MTAKMMSWANAVARSNFLSCSRVALASLGIVLLISSASTPPLLATLQDGRAPDVCIVRLETTKGNVDIEVTRDWAPLGADRFVSLVRQGYYDDNRFFRIQPATYVQFGVNGDPATAQLWRTKTFADDPFKQSNVRGTVAFAFAVANGRTTQVFVNLRDNSSTHDKEPFTPFGRVVAGMEIMDALNAEHRQGIGGIRAGGQDPFFQGGNKWLDEKYPRLDAIKRARVIERGK
jgi:cyclophilin family peptidyl-prolyl cis-trans isomerase